MEEGEGMKYFIVKLLAKLIGFTLKIKDNTIYLNSKTEYGKKNIRMCVKKLCDKLKKQRNEEN